MAQITKRICIPVGQYFKEGETKPMIEYREIGFVIEFSDAQGRTWQELRLHVDAFNPVLATLMRGQMEKGSSNARGKLFDVARKKTVSSPCEDQNPEDDDVPF